MMDAVPKLSKSVANYDSHCIRANAKFSAIEKNMQSIKTDPYIFI